MNKAARTIWEVICVIFQLTTDGKIIHKKQQITTLEDRLKFTLRKSKRALLIDRIADLQQEINFLYAKRGISAGSTGISVDDPYDEYYPPISGQNPV